MSKSKPKTALAKLLDSVSDANPLAGAEVRLANVRNEDVVVQEEAVQAPQRIEKVIEDEANINNNQILNSITPTLKYIHWEQCFPWAFADRPDDEMGNIKELADSVENNGQQEPILVRPIQGRGKIKYEVVFGNRRWRACKLKNLNILAIVKNVDDQEAALYQKEENENRQDLSDFARAKSFKVQLEAGIFKSENELSKKLGISRQSLNDIMAFNRLPKELTTAIGDLRSISRRTAAKLATLSRDKVVLKTLIRLAPKVSTKAVNSTNVDLFIERSKSNKSTSDTLAKHDVKDSKGIKMFSIRESLSGEITIKINHNFQGKYEINDVKEIIYQFLNTKK